MHSCKIVQLDFSVPHTRKKSSFFHSNPFHINYFDQIQRSPMKSVGVFGGFYCSKHGTLHGTGIKPTSLQLKLDVKSSAFTKNYIQRNVIFCSVCFKHNSILMDFM